MAILALTLFSLCAEPPSLIVQDRPLTAPFMNKLAMTAVNYTFKAQIKPGNDGVMWRSDFAKKAKCFSKWITISPLQPSIVVILE